MQEKKPLINIFNFIFYNINYKDLSQIPNIKKLNFCSEIFSFKPPILPNKTGKVYFKFKFFRINKVGVRIQQELILEFLGDCYLEARDPKIIIKFFRENNQKFLTILNRFISEVSLKHTINLIQKKKLKVPTIEDFQREFKLPRTGTQPKYKIPDDFHDLDSSELKLKQ